MYLFTSSSCAQSCLTIPLLLVYVLMYYLNSCCIGIKFILYTKLNHLLLVQKLPKKKPWSSLLGTPKISSFHIFQESKQVWKRTWCQIYTTPLHQRTWSMLIPWTIKTTSTCSKIWKLLVHSLIRCSHCVDLRIYLRDQLAAICSATLGDSNCWRGSNKYSVLLTRSIYSTQSLMK